MFQTIYLCTFQNNILDNPSNRNKEIRNKKTIIIIHKITTECIRNTNEITVLNGPDRRILKGVTINLIDWHLPAQY